MKIPLAVRARISELGKEVINGDRPIREAADDGAKWLLAKHRLIAGEVLASWFVSKIRQWTFDTLRNTESQTDMSQAIQLPFPQLPAWLEVAPGMKRHQNAMTDRDWKMCVRIYENRRDEAGRLYDMLYACAEVAVSQIRSISKAEARKWLAS